jgi:hypothetical protein
VFSVKYELKFIIYMIVSFKGLLLLLLLLLLPPNLKLPLGQALVEGWNCS